MGAHASTVHGTFAPEFAKQMPGAEDDPRFWASGLSVIAHPWNPHVPTVHMNTRFVVTAKAWFGGGADLTPTLDARRRARRSRRDRCSTTRCAALASAIPAAASYEKLKAWCDEYFFLKHRGEPRGIGGIFYDYLNSAGDAANSAWDADFAFTRDVGETFIAAYSEIVRRNFAKPWTRRRARGAARAPRPLRRIQPALRSRHGVRAEDRRQCRLDPLLDAAAGALAVSGAGADHRRGIAKMEMAK